MTDTWRDAYDALEARITSDPQFPDPGEARSGRNRAGGGAGAGVMLRVEITEDGTALIECDAHTAARLAGRREFGQVEATQSALKDALCGAWYDADCPPLRQ